MKTTRVRIIEYLQKKGLSSTADLSRALKTTPANMRHHLSVLASEGAVSAVAQRPSDRRGRPARLFALTSTAQSHNLDRLAHALLGELSEVDGTLAPSNERIQAIAQRLVGSQQRPDASLNQRLFGAMQRLNEQHYQARWEARADAPRIIFSHCPYAAILPQHPELCQMDTRLLSSLLQAEVKLTQRLVQSASGDRQCIFSVLRLERPADKPRDAMG